HRAAPAGAAGCGDHAHVDDGVDALLGDHLGDHRVADVGADERDVADVVARGYGVDADHALDAGVGGEAPGEPPTEVAGDPRDQHDLAVSGVDAHGAPSPAVGLTSRACVAARASSSAACGASSSPSACDAS